MTALDSEYANNPEPSNTGFLGPSYPYTNNIKPPNEIGISSRTGSCKLAGRFIHHYFHYTTTICCTSIKPT